MRLSDESEILDPVKLNRIRTLLETLSNDIDMCKKNKEKQKPTRKAKQRVKRPTRTKQTMTAINDPKIENLKAEQF